MKKGRSTEKDWGKEEMESGKERRWRKRRVRKMRNRKARKRILKGRRRRRGLIIRYKEGIDN